MRGFSVYVKKLSISNYIFFAISIGLLSLFAELLSFVVPFSWSKVLDIFCSMGEIERGQMDDLFMGLKLLAVSAVPRGEILP